MTDIMKIDYIREGLFTPDIEPILEAMLSSNTHSVGNIFLNKG